VRSSGTSLCLASGSAFGAMAIFAKLAYREGATVGTVLSVRFTLAAALFWAVVLATGGLRELRALPARDVRAGLALGACGYALQSGCYFAALERIDASLLSLLLYTFPAMVAAAAVALGRERMDCAGCQRWCSRRAGSPSWCRAPARARWSRSESRSGWAPRWCTAPTSW
jgi:drug/metabolite transporter (DMT)-like permease